MSQGKTRELSSVVVGVTGGMGTGKSTVSKLLAAKGYSLIDSDALIKERILKDPAVIEQIRVRFGANLLDSEGQVDRQRLAQTVFSDARQLRWLEGVTHPRLFDCWRTTMREKQHCRWVLEVPLLFEKQLENWFDFIVCVASSPKQQFARLEQRGIPRTLAEQRISQQLPLATKIDYSDFVLWNDGSIGFLQSQVETLLKDLNSRC